MENYFSLSAEDFNGSCGQQKSFKVYKVDENVSAQPTYTSRAFRNIYLLTGKTQIQFAGKQIHSADAILMFEPPRPYSLILPPGSSGNYGCMVSRELLQSEFCLKAYTHLISFAGIDGEAIFSLNSKQKDFIVCIFKKLMSEQETGYIFNHELFCNYLNLMLYEVLKQLSALPGLPSV